MLVFFLLQLCVLFKSIQSVIHSQHYIVRETNNNILSKSERINTGVCRAYRNGYNTDSSYMDECENDYIVTKRYYSLDCTGEYVIVDTIESGSLEMHTFKKEYEVECSGNNNSPEWIRLFYYDSDSCNNKIIADDTHCIGTLISSNSFCFVDNLQTWKVTCQNNIYSAKFFDKPTKYNQDETKYCKNGSIQDQCSANFGIYGSACVPRGSKIYNILVGENFIGGDYLHLKLTSGKTDSITNDNLQANLEEIEIMLEKGAFLNKKSHDGNLLYSPSSNNGVTRPKRGPGGNNGNPDSQGQNGLESSDEESQQSVPRIRPVVYGGPKYARLSSSQEKGDENSQNSGNNNDQLSNSG